MHTYESECKKRFEGIQSQKKGYQLYIHVHFVCEQSLFFVPVWANITKAYPVTIGYSELGCFMYGMGGFDWVIHEV